MEVAPIRDSIIVIIDVDSFTKDRGRNLEVSDEELRVIERLVENLRCL